MRLGIRLVVGLLSASACTAHAQATFTPLGDLPGGEFSSSASGVSDDGRFVTGASSSASGSEAFRWERDVGMTPLGDLAGGTFASEGRAISADGSVVVGVGYFDSPPAQQGFRWSQAGGLVLLPELLAGGADEGGAFGVSPDGQVVVGQSRGASGNVEAVRWIGSGPAESLGIPAGAARANGDASTSDGSLVVGRASSLDFGTRIGFVWDATNGIRSASDYLELELELGLDVADWEIEELRDVSPDGRFIVGTGLNPSGDREGFLVTVPEPASGLAAVVSVVSVLALARTRKRAVTSRGRVPTRS